MKVLIAILLPLILVTGELAARFYEALPTPPPADLPAEFFQLRTHLTPDGFWQVDDFHGAIFTVDRGARRVVGQPATYDLTVWIFGNSVAFDAYVADGDSMASQLQRLLNQVGLRWRVVNLAVPGELSGGDVARFEHTAVKPGDLVVFINGVDLGFRPDCANWLAAYHLACNWIQTVEPPDTAPYRRNMARARADAAARSTIFYAFIQPNRQPHVTDCLPGPHLYAPPDGFVDAWHLNQAGDVAVARQLFDSITLF